MKIVLVVMSVVAVGLAVALGVVLWQDSQDDGPVVEAVVIADAQIVWCWQHIADVATAADVLDLRRMEDVAGWSYLSGLEGVATDWDDARGLVIEAYTDARAAAVDWLDDKGFVEPVSDDLLFVHLADAVTEDEEVRQACLAAWGAEHGQPAPLAAAHEAEGLPWWHSPEVVGAIIGAFIGAFAAGLVGFGVARYTHRLDKKQAGAEAAERQRQELIRLSSNADLRLTNVLATLNAKPLGDFGVIEDRRRVWGMIVDDLRVGMREVAVVATVYSDRGTELELACAKMAKVFGGVLRWGYEMCYGSTTAGVTVHDEYRSAVEAARPTLEAFSDAWAMQVGLDVSQHADVYTRADE